MVEPLLLHHSFLHGVWIMNKVKQITMKARFQGSNKIIMEENTAIITEKKSKISLHGQHNRLADVHEQVEILEHHQTGDFAE